MDMLEDFRSWSRIVPKQNLVVLAWCLAPN